MTALVTAYALAAAINAGVYAATEGAEKLREGSSPPMVALAALLFGAMAPALLIIWAVVWCVQVARRWWGKS